MSEMKREKSTRSAAGTMVCMALFAVLGLVAPTAQAAKPKLDGQLIAPLATKGNKIEAPVLLTSKSAKSLGVGKALATVTTKASKKLKAPNPYGKGQIEVAAETLRPGDRLKGRGKLKGKADKLMPKVKGTKLKIASRESRFSNDELADAIIALANQLNALSLRVDQLEATLLAELAALKAQLDGLPDIDALLAQIEALEASLNSLTGRVDGLETDLDGALDDIATLQSQVTTLQSTVGSLQSSVGTLQTQMATVQGQILTIQGQITTIQGQITTICSDAALTIC
jgi:predicted  nucleic acid-binding Zn-ribbon protein